MSIQVYAANTGRGAAVSLRALFFILCLGFLSCALLGTSPLYAADQQAAEVNLEKWDQIAQAAEAELERGGQSDRAIQDLRASLADWRGRLSTAQSSNSARIATLRDQIAALGVPPEGGAAEAPEIAQKRQELSEQLTRAEAPGIAAEAAYRRADGLIQEIDTILRERAADQLLKLWPSPLNPVHWPEAVIGLSDGIILLWKELSSGWNDPRDRAKFYDSLPLIVILSIIAIATTVFARPWITAFSDRLRLGKTEARRRIFGLLASLGLVVVPTIGMIALSVALVRTGFLGPVTSQLAQALPLLGFMVFGAIWLGGRSFPRIDSAEGLLDLPEGRRSEGRVLAGLMGAVLAVETLRQIVFDGQSYSDAVLSLLSFPLICFGALCLWRIGRLMNVQFIDHESGNYQGRLLSLLGRGIKVLAFVATLLAAFGYVTAGSALVFQTILSLGLLALILILQRLLSDLWAVVYPADDAVAENERLVPVLFGFGLGLLSLPVFALIWGSRLSDLSELWTRFGAGFRLGEARVSPTDFLVFAMIFALGYLITRLFQGTLRNTILPRTRMDRGGQNALVSGTGYVGIFLAALVAINATGIDLSGLAIVASALSVGIGFGLQNIVQNFVSGIILMIERPVSEGDWIEVGTTQGVVKTISVRSTRIQTFDRNVVVVPNADLVSQRVTNWTRFGLAGRLIVPVGVAYGTDTRKVERVLREIAEAQPLVILNPAPLVVFQGFGVNSMDFELRVILRDVNFTSSVRTEINHMIAERFPLEDIEIPFAQSDITLRNLDELARLISGAGGERAEPAPDRAVADPQGRAAEGEK
ncbi:DUF3772 domain-containing protein [Pseudogemmobacter faecipullorum]|uniref:Mechanosensitive ion channel family protein n=1 Tax=Pseudogemmobacter faecipullorum TaxID=2755041 RepID=A0ABS8CLJ5_9RHOB|nr:DUF3772 domain-containing protein [Pseudogemmobacter faecipullorum]MCB5410258.1 mechanosensitive ion channel family protein [Pseudogemmobacter faecipullorum]